MQMQPHTGGLLQVGDFPTEIHQVIIDQANPYDLKALSRVSRRFRDLAKARLFETLTFKTNERDFRVHSTMGRRIRLDLEGAQPLTFSNFVKHVRLDTLFLAPFWDWRDSRCPHSRYTTFRSSPLMKFFEQLPDNSLESFSWNLGTCLPDDIFNAYLPRKQSTIKSLSLMTDPHCDDWMRTTIRSGTLTQFHDLREFSWKGFPGRKDLRSIHKLLEVQQQTLESLELDFIGQLPDRDVDLLMDFVLPSTPNGENIPLESLSKLYLSCVAYSSSPDLPTALNMGKLKSLTLHSGSNVPAFLRTITDQGFELSLTFLELVIVDATDFLDSDDEPRNPSLIAFLQSFSGLEHLHILVSPARAHSEYWEAIANHKSTLKNFLYHERDNWRSRHDESVLSHEPPPDRDIELGVLDDRLFGDEYNRPLPPQMKLYDTQFLDGCFADSKLECLAICDQPHLLQTKFQAAPLPQHLKLLHLRLSTYSGICDDFASWLGPLGADFRKSYAHQLEQWDLRGRPSSIHGYPDDPLLRDNNPPFTLNSNPFGFKGFFGPDWAWPAGVASYDWYEVFTLANWSFGPSGPPRMQVLAIGDFKRNGHDPNAFVLFSRLDSDVSSLNFRSMAIDTRAPQSRPFGLSIDELDHFEGISQPFEFLAACPIINPL